MLNWITRKWFQCKIIYDVDIPIFFSVMSIITAVGIL